MNKRKVSHTVLVTERRLSALKRLQSQLKRKTKPEKHGTNMIKLSDRDIRRIEAEITTLKSRI